MSKIKKFFSSDPNPHRLDLLGDASKINPEVSKKMGEFMLTSDDPVADLFVVRASKRVLEQTSTKRPRSKNKTDHPPTIGLAH